MSSEALPAPVKNFIKAHIRSVSQLEILALIIGEPGTAWTARSIDRFMRSNEQSVEKQLAQFVRAGLLEMSEGTPAAYRYRPQDEALAAAAAATVREYRTRQVLVIETIFKPDDDSGQSFADAFRIRP